MNSKIWLSSPHIFQYIEIFYNKKRKHSALNYKTIEELNQKNIIYKNVA